MNLSKFVSYFLCLSLLFSVPFAAGATQLETEDSAAVSSGAHSIDAAVPYLQLQQPIENATAVFLYETGSETLMYAQNPDMKVYPSSLVKIMTALIAVEKAEPTTMITVDAKVLSEVPSDAVSVDLLEGEQISLNDLIYCMMVGSANDAASVIAAHISGSQSAFVEEMNRYAESLGCNATKFTNPHGLHDPEQYSTVRDLARILQAAVANEKFMTYFSAVNYVVPATNLSEKRELSSTNFLRNNEDMEIYYDSRVTGGRTGISDDGTRCLAASAESDGLSLISVLMGAQSTFADNGNTSVYGSFKETTTLMDAVFGEYRSAQILYEGQSLRRYTVANGTNDVVAGSDRAVTTILPVDAVVEKLDYRYYDISRELQAPVNKGDVISRVEVWYGNMCVAQADLLAMNSVPSLVQEGQSKESGSKGGKVFLSVMIWIVVAAGVTVGALFVLRRLNIAVIKKKGIRYRRNRRRSR